MKLYFLLLACGFAMSLQAQHVHHGRTKIDTTAAYRLSEVRVTGKTGVAHIRKSGYNAMTIDTKSMQNTTKTLADALRAAPGIKLRETGGVGGQTNIMLDGMDAKYVKVFIDGVPQEGIGSAYRLSNIPVGMADHIEVYKGVVPVEFGTDAMGGRHQHRHAPQTLPVVCRRVLFLRLLQHPSDDSQIRPEPEARVDVRREFQSELF